VGVGPSKVARDVGMGEGIVQGLCDCIHLAVSGRVRLGHSAG
jgi:hypothetical protein